MAASSIKRLLARPMGRAERIKPVFSVHAANARDVVKALARPHFEAHTEIEVPFFSTLELLQERVNLADLHAQHLFQAYIPQQSLPEVLRRLGSASELLKNLHSSMLSRARLRRVVDLRPATHGVERFFLQLKTSKNGGISRTELGMELPKARFSNFLKLATAGAVEKIRYISPGTIRSARGALLPAEAHIDILLAAGRSVDLNRIGSGPIAQQPFVFIDVELPSVQLVPLLAEPKRHSFSFLSQAISVLDQERWIRRATSTRMLAASGVTDRNFRRALKALTERLPSCGT